MNAVLLGAELGLDTPRLSGVAHARRFVRGLLEAWEVRCFSPDAELITSELVTNAILHGRCPIRLKLGVDDSLLRIEVTDRGAGEVAIPEAGQRDIGGQGLRLVSTLAPAWGVQLEDTGKTVWADLRLKLIRHR